MSGPGRGAGPSYNEAAPADDAVTNPSAATPTASNLPRIAAGVYGGVYRRALVERTHEAQQVRTNHISVGLPEEPATGRGHDRNHNVPGAVRVVAEVAARRRIVRRPELDESGAPSQAYRTLFMRQGFG